MFHKCIQIGAFTSKLYFCAIWNNIQGFDPSLYQLYLNYKWIPRIPSNVLIKNLEKAHLTFRQP